MTITEMTNKRGNKRGQATVFIIFGIAIVIGIILMFYLRSSFIDETTGGKIFFLDDAGKIGAPVENYVQSCLEKTSENALIFIGKHGGYYNLPQATDTLFSLPYYLYAGESKIPSKEEVERQLSLYVNNELFFCLRGFYEFYNQGIQVKTGEANTTAKINENNVFFDVNLPIYIKKGDVSKNLEKFSASVPSRLNTIFNVADSFIREQERTPYSVCLSCLINLGGENDLRIEVSFVREGEMLFKIVDERVSVKEMPYEFSFMNKYDFKEEGRKE